MKRVCLVSHDNYSKLYLDHKQKQKLIWIIIESVYSNAVFIIIYFITFRVFQINVRTIYIWSFKINLD